MVQIKTYFDKKGDNEQKAKNEYSDYKASYGNIK